MKRYEEVYKDIEKKILSGSFPAGSYLPSENELKEEFLVSRETIRKALNLLMNAGLIQKKQGKGSMVIERKLLNFPVSGLTSYKELQRQQGFTSKTKVVKLFKKKINALDAERTGFPLDSEVWYLLRERLIDGKSVVLDEDILLTSFIPNLTVEIAENSIYDYFENELGLEIAYAEKEITISSVNDEDKLYLALSTNDINVVSIKSRVYLSDSTLFQYTESRHRVDKFRFVDFARRNKI
ncbi:GntR family transcriptional regulator, trehalose operon transcriptional repressor [Pilibacter termitis]|uniref:Trehalose operon repressor n=1 Tax=Pilibacter termitis TaxID=263852 RepID=A0A1T4Q112_9ENTE|nr:trehalose operon repressor [Pilibacter termitis]SJZ97266.1 GntR family transcriptional regulator, trehalose operon transcriptional repressor [Pilibacter termitis]